MVIYIPAIKIYVYQLLGQVEQNIVTCRWREDQIFADAEDRGQ